jgi:hypothetical protein
MCLYIMFTPRDAAPTACHLPTLPQEDYRDAHTSRRNRRARPLRRSRRISRPPKRGRGVHEKHVCRRLDAPGVVLRRRSRRPPCRARRVLDAARDGCALRPRARSLPPRPDDSRFAPSKRSARTRSSKRSRKSPKACSTARSAKSARCWAQDGRPRNSSRTHEG